MYNILWDFDGTIAYRDGMWSGTLFSLLGKNCIKNIPVENIKPYLNKGFTWHTPEYSHKELFNGKTWNEYYENYFYTIFTKLGIEENIAEQLSKNVIIEYMDKTKRNIYDDVIKALEETIEKGHRNYILSNHVPGLNKIVENIGIQKYFNGIYNSGNIGYEKPNIKFYKRY
ncbi:MAG: HAD hydrolase-like protein [Treponema sp.]|jgi:putative hydrolase of the HAD superfamily|nr:HAD hydrolase-like protein [Treponema sp.]